MTDIFDGLARIRHEFLAAHMKPPTVILLESHDEGERFLAGIRQTHQFAFDVGSPDLGQPVQMADGSAWMEVKAMGIKVRWPADRIAMPDGSWSYT